MGIEIRPAIESDVPLILAFIRELAEYERLSHQCVASEQLLREHLFGPNPTAFALMAFLDQRAAGYALYFRNFSTFLARPGIYLEDVYVSPQFRGKGIGQALLRRVARIAVEQNAGRLEWAVLDWNAPAIGFYKKLGAVPLDDWTVFRVTGDALNQLGSQT